MAASPLVPLLEERFGWRRLAAGGRLLWFRGAVHRETPETIAQAAAGLTREAVPAWLDGLDGHFALVLSGPDWSIAAVDPVRGYPLIWAARAGQVFVTHDGPAMCRRLGLGPEGIDPEQGDAFSLAGFTIGPRTIYRDVHQLAPGTFVTVEPDGGASVSAYHLWRPTAPEAVTKADLVEPMSALNERLIDDLVKSAAGRPILVPLSAGVDSRFVASGLAAAGYRNVHCVGYGRAGNREAHTAAEIARRLGYKWTFIPYTNRVVGDAWANADHDAYEAYANCLTAIPFPQDYPALTALRAEGALDPETIVVNGQSGDFTSGNHIAPTLLDHDGGSPERRMDRVLNALVAKHFKHWPALMTRDRMSRVRAMLTAEIEKAGGLPDDPGLDYGVYEISEFADRQAKYVIHGQRLYEYLGLEWRLPLWERASIDFWEKAPLEAKARQCLYKEVLRRDDWGGVWRDIPINPTRIRPLWLYSLRLALKALHAPLGAARWHRFERRYLNYFMSPLCAYAAWSWWDVARETSDAHGAIAFHIRKYMDGAAGCGSAWFPR